MDQHVITDRVKERRGLAAERTEEKKLFEEKDKTLKEKCAVIDTELSEFINFNTGVRNIRTTEGLVYASRTDYYNVMDRVLLNEWILEPVKGEIPKDVYRELLNRVSVLSNYVNKPVCNEYRLQNGGEQIDKHVEGGALPEGVHCSPKIQLNYRK